MLNKETTNIGESINKLTTPRAEWTKNAAKPKAKRTKTVTKPEKIPRIVNPRNLQKKSTPTEKDAEKIYFPPRVSLFTESTSAGDAIKCVMKNKIENTNNKIIPAPIRVIN